MVQVHIIHIFSQNKNNYTSINVETYKTFIYNADFVTIWYTTMIL